MPHSLTVLTAAMTGGVVGGPATAGGGGCCGLCPWCPCCPAAPAAATGAHAGMTLGGGAAPAAMAPGAAVPGGWGAGTAAGGYGASMAPGAAGGYGASMVPGAAGGYGASMAPGAAGGAGYGTGGYYGAAAGSPALTAVMAWFSRANDEAGRLIQELRGNLPQGRGEKEDFEKELSEASTSASLGKYSVRRRRDSNASAVHGFVKTGTSRKAGFY
ncbi:UNVERIFIED_CONTAM: hypothetical protein HHA_270170 [Hammondia hammondi]|eukprot:XP_008882394.1 hypothetical protein HHA_270170 [Hammondia hammondi]